MSCLIAPSFLSQNRPNYSKRMSPLCTHCLLAVAGSVPTRTKRTTFCTPGAWDHAPQGRQGRLTTFGLKGLAVKEKLTKEISYNHIISLVGLGHLWSHSELLCWGLRSRCGTVTGCEQMLTGTTLIHPFWAAPTDYLSLLSLQHQLQVVSP